MGNGEITSLFKDFATSANSTVKRRYTLHIPKILRSRVRVFRFMAFLIAFRFFSFTLIRPSRMT